VGLRPKKRVASVFCLLGGLEARPCEIRVIRAYYQEVYEAQEILGSGCTAYII